MATNKTVKLNDNSILAIKWALLKIFITTTDNKAPINPPNKVRIQFSTRNWYTRVADDAPKAFRTPISDDRSKIRVMLIFTRFRVGNERIRATKMLIAVST